MISRSEYNAKAREAGIYMQTFIRSRRDEFSEAAIESNPKKGWQGNGAEEAHNASMILWNYTDEYFVNCLIPENYGSPAALTKALFGLQKIISTMVRQLDDISREPGESSAETLNIAQDNLNDTLYATEETLALLADAASATSGASVVSSMIPMPMEIIQEIANRFPGVVARMKIRRKGRAPVTVQDEYDVQYLFQGLLSVSFLDIRPEEPTPSVAGGSGRADTLLKLEKIVVEYKCTRSGLEYKELRKQISDDFMLYGKHLECERLFVFVYDPENRIPNKFGFESDLAVKVDGIKEVRVVVRS